MRLVDVRADVVVDVAPHRPEILLAGWPVAAADALSAELRLRGLPVRTVNVASLSALAARGEAAVLALGPELRPEAALAVLRDVVRADARRAWVVVALASGDEPELFQELVDEDRIFFLSSAPPSTVETADLLGAASTRAARQEPVEDDAEAELQGRVLDLLRRLGRESDLTTALRETTREMRMVADADARIWLYDERTESLSCDARRESAVAGLTSYAARTARSIAVERAGDDPRYDADLDADLDRASGDPRERFMACPLVLSSRVLGVLALTRSTEGRPFGDVDRQRIEWAASLLASAHGRLIHERELEERAAARHTAIRADVAQLFRGEALDQYQRGRPDEAHLLEVEPRWTRHAYRVVLALIGAALLFGAAIYARFW
ncbi:MAG TPA: GAF domain-containing protein [Thermoanaerobaculia bacterium]|nr:GAF domain-containing protein [Thermoanaerobaculia bacterium]